MRVLVSKVYTRSQDAELCPMGGIDVWGWRRGQACAPGPPCAPYTAFSPHVSRSSFFGKVPRVKYAGFTRHALHPLQAGIMSSNALTILPSGLGTSNNGRFCRVMGHNVGAVFNLVAVFTAPSRPLLRLNCRGTSPSCRGEPFQRHQAANVVGQVLGSRSWRAPAPCQ